MPYSRRFHENVQPVEFDTARDIQAFVGLFLALLAKHFGGETTVNHLRIGSFIGLRTLYEDTSTSNKEIAQALGISHSTVSRIVHEFIEQKWIRQRPHPEDGRRRLIEIVPGHPLTDQFERDFRRLLNRMLQSFEERKLILLDPDKHAF
ncbi:MAG: MarR family transcriptional regulator [Gammaproteobacteria bacterium]